MTPHERTEARAAFTALMPDQAEVLRPTKVRSATQRGRWDYSETTAATYPCKVVAAPLMPVQAGGQVVAVADWAVRLPALADVRAADKLRITLAETGEVKTGEVQSLRKRSGELARLALMREIGDGGS